MPKAPVTKKKTNYSLGFEALDMIDDLVADTIKTTGKGKKSRELEAAIKLAHATRFGTNIKIKQVQ